MGVADGLSSLQCLDLTGCTHVTDKGVSKLGHLGASLRQLNLELVSEVSDLGMQALLRRCKALEDLNIGGCNSLTSVTTMLICDHCCKTLKVLNLGGIPGVNDNDMHDIASKLLRLESLTVRSCCRVSDAGLRHLAK